VADKDEPLKHPIVSALRGGSNQARVRDHNERLVLSLIRRNGSLSKAQIARLSGLSAQTATVIMRALETDELLVRGTPVRGRVGQPSVPMHLNPDGAYSIGLKVGRRSADLVLMDFAGNVKSRRRSAYTFPITADIVAFVTSGTRDLLSGWEQKQRDKIAGIGIAIPFQLWNWGQLVGAPVEEMEAWRGFDLKRAISLATGFDAYLENDATAACGAELVLGRGREFENFCYLFVGFFIGGGIVLNNNVFSGPSGNAGSFGTMPIYGSGPDYIRLLDSASIFVLENMLLKDNKDPAILWQRPDQWGDLGETLNAWVEQVASSLLMAIIATCSVIDFSAVLIDGGFPEQVREMIVEATAKKLEQMKLEGIHPVKIYSGSIGPNAPAMGGAILPIVSRYFISQTAIYN